MSGQSRLKGVIITRFGSLWEFCRHTGTHPSRVSQILNGRRPLTVTQRQAWAEVLGVDERFLDPTWDPLAPLNALVGGPMAQEEVEANKEQIGSEDEEGREECHSSSAGSC